MKIKTIFCLFLLIILWGCNSKLSTGSAENIIRNYLKLSNEEKVEIIGISEESKNIKLVKFQVDNTQSSARFRKYDNGWQMDEMQMPTGEWVPVTMIKSGDEEMKQLEKKVKGIWAQVDNIYQRRLDLIPSLIEAVKGMERTENETISALGWARNNASQIRLNDNTVNDPDAFKKYQLAQDQLGTSISEILRKVDNYRDITSDPKFREILVQLEGTENRITMERQRYNEAAQEFNSAKINYISGKNISDKPYFKSYDDINQQKVRF